MPFRWLPVAVSGLDQLFYVKEVLGYCRRDDRIRYERIIIKTIFRNISSGIYRSCCKNTYRSTGMEQSHLLCIRRYPGETRV